MHRAIARARHAVVLTIMYILTLGTVVLARPADAPPSPSPTTPQPTTQQTTQPTTPLSLPGAQAYIYRSATPQHEPVRLHVFKPDAWKPDDRRPALVFFFGGGFNRGTPAQSAGWARWATQRGMVGIAPDYRTRDRFGTTPREAVADARAALRWVQDHAEELGVDLRRIVVGGSSSGGMIALWTAIERPPPQCDPNESPHHKPAALVLLSAPVDILNSPRAARFGPRGSAELSPLQHLDERMPPVLALHGDADTIVRHDDSVKLRDKLLATGNVCELMTIPGGAHNFIGTKPEWREKTQAALQRFLEQHVVTPDDD